jgi:hypothetical protein
MTIIEAEAEKYRPSNGTDGASFFEEYCSNCARDKAMNGSKLEDDCDDNDLCQIIAATFRCEVTDPEYPHEWCYGKDGFPCCTAFVPAGEPIPEPRCDHTPDMFAGTNEV